MAIICLKTNESQLQSYFNDKLTCGVIFVETILAAIACCLRAGIRPWHWLCRTMKKPINLYRYLCCHWRSHTATFFTGTYILTPLEAFIHAFKDMSAHQNN